jgi:hypothetical protein
MNASRRNITEKSVGLEDHHGRTHRFSHSPSKRDRRLCPVRLSPSYPCHLYSILDCCVLVGDCTGFWACGGRKRHTSVIPTPQTRVPRVVGVRARAGSGRLTGSPRGLWGDTTQPVLKSVTCAYLPQMVGHTPRRAQTNRLGLATDCASDAPHHEEATRPS